MQDDYILVFVTTPFKKGVEIAQKLVSSRLAACVSVFPVRSLYWWENKINEDAEELLVVKTKKALFEKIKKEILSIHPYEVPEIISVPIVDGFDKYLQWLDDTVAFPKA